MLEAKDWLRSCFRFQKETESMSLAGEELEKQSKNSLKLLVGR